MFCRSDHKYNHHNGNQVDRSAPWIGLCCVWLNPWLHSHRGTDQVTFCSHLMWVLVWELEDEEVEDVVSDEGLGSVNPHRRNQVVA